VTIKTQTVLMVTLLLVLAVLVTAGVMGWNSRRALLAETETQGLVIARLLARSAAFGAQVTSDVENAIGEQMVVEATMAAHLVALGEAAGIGANEINRRLKQIADDTVLDEIWITDEKGHAYLRNITEIDFTFSPDRERQPQAHAFWPLLTGKSKNVVQEALQREVDTQVFKYVGVAGVDKPRIVQVGYHASMLQQLRQRMGLTRLVNQLVSEGSVIAIRVLDKSMITVDYAEKLRDNKLPEPTEIELTNLRQLVRERRTESYFGSVSAKGRGSDRGGGRRTKRRSDSGYTSYGSFAGCYSHWDSVGNGRERARIVVRVNDRHFRRQQDFQANCRLDGDDPTDRRR
jgi:adenylate cyclase